MKAREAMVRDFAFLGINQALLDKCVANVHFLELGPEEQIYFATMLLERLGNFFQGADVYLASAEGFEHEFRRFQPTMGLFKTRDLLRGVRGIVSGKYPDLQYAPNPHQLQAAIKSFQKAAPSHQNNLSLCPPITDEQLAYYFKTPEARAAYRAQTIESDNQYQEMFIKE